VPTFVIIAVLGEGWADKLLIFSQVVLSLQLGFAVIPLVMFTGDRALMGPLVSARWVTAAGYGLGAIIIAVNAWLVVQTFAG
jgi:manganese transport protein